MFRNRRWIVLHMLLKERTHLLDELIEFLHSRPDQFNQADKPFAPIAGELGAPESRLTQDRLETPRELVDRQPQDVLLVEPVKLLRAEDSVPAADTLERERRDQLIACEELSIVAWRPAEERKEIHHGLREVTEALVFHD